MTGTLYAPAGSLVPDPLPLPVKVDQSVAGADIKLQNMTLTGLKYFELRDVNVDLSAQEVSEIWGQINPNRVTTPSSFT